MTATELEKNILRDEIERLTKELFKAKSRYSREWVGLTDDEIKKILGPLGSWGPTPVKGYTRKLFDDIEAALKEKNS